MLNQLIARCVVNALQPINGPVISRLAGLVRTLETDAFTKGVVSRFPIPVDAAEADCSVSGVAFPDLVPTETERLIVYFEDGGSVNNSGKWTSKLRLVGWGNSTLFEDTPPDVLVPMLIARISKLLRTVQGADPVGSLRCEVTGSPAAGVNLFGNYTYSQTRSQYLFYPYVSFGLDLTLTFVLNDDCLDSLIGADAAIC